MDVEMRLSCCAACGVSFAFPLAIARRREDDHKTFYCPNGHANYYPDKSEAEILRDRLRAKEREISELKEAEQRRISALRKAKRSKSKKATKGIST